jgi:uncharacterized membrane protein YqhA
MMTQDCHDECKHREQMEKEHSALFMERMFPVFGSASRLILFVSAILCAVGASAVLWVVTKKLLWQAIIVPIYTGNLKIEGFNSKVMMLVEGYLLCSVFYITGLGLYGMVVTGKRCWPKWLGDYSNLDILKEKLTGLIVTILSIEFLDFMLRVMHSFDASIVTERPYHACALIGSIGVVSALVIMSLVFYIRSLPTKDKIRH